MKHRNESENLLLEIDTGFSGNYSKSTVNHLDSRAIQYNSEGSLIFSHMLKYIFPQDSKGNFMISYFSLARQSFIYLGTNPIDNTALIPKQEFENGILKIKFRLISNSDSAFQLPNDEGSDDGEKVGRRTKERKIGYIIEKVARWRNLYNGVQNSKGNTIRMTLEEAAKQVEISKKSLDDYLLQLRFGRKFGFNFEEHKNDKVGILRAYVKKFKKLQSNTELENAELKDSLNGKGTPTCKSNKCCVPPPGMI
ncbi:hypothetical protein SteCoe_22676 [Stentor coeruleus]|uniref:Uncharacterized protein n=1 Tax=Stentor coeruleus TaxID=5963 RepID=A0A1R2BLM9_9CILI|nr:hypothetical protein SteCoe_22676 [Stentor coeruleus]